MESFALVGFALFLPILSVLPAWQRMSREARNARGLSEDVRALLALGDDERAISVIEQEASSIAPSVVAVIRRVNRPQFRPEGLLSDSVCSLAVSIFSVVGVLLVVAGALLFCLIPCALYTLLFGLSMMQAGKMLAEARQELLKARRLLLAVIHEAS